VSSKKSEGDRREPTQREATRHAVLSLSLWVETVDSELEDLGAYQVKRQIALMRALDQHRKALIKKYNRTMEEKGIWNQDGTRNTKASIRSS